MSVAEARRSRPAVHRTRPAAPVVAIACLVLAFAALATAILASRGAPFRVDVALHDWSVAHRRASSVDAARLLTATAGGVVPYLAAGLAGWLAFGARAAPWRKLVTALAGALDVVVGELVVRSALSAAIARPRPPLPDWAAAASGGSFPSGHTTVSAIAAGLVVWATRRAGSRAARRAIAVPALSWPLAVGLSRVYLGVHWLTDVLGAWLLAASWLALTVPMAARLEESGTPRVQGRHRRAPRVARTSNEPKA